MNEVAERKKFLDIFIYFSPSLYTTAPYSMMTTKRQDKTTDKDKITENNKMIDNELMKMTGV